MQRDVVSLIDICASKETNMRKDLSKYFVPGIIDYSNRYVEAFKASIHRDNGIGNSGNEVLILLNSISSIEKRQFKCGVYSKGPTVKYWRIHLQNSLYYDFDHKTGLAIIALWKRHFLEDEFTMTEESKAYEKQSRREENA